MSIKEIHDWLFDYLIAESERKPDLVFRPRRTNRANKLKMGYWFLGNEDYLTVGFWRGMDWKRKIPNIGFTVYPDGSCKLVLSASDSKQKLEFFKKRLFDKLDYIRSGKQLEFKTVYNDLSQSYFEYDLKSSNYQEGIRKFLDLYWPAIQKEIRFNDFEFDTKLPLGIIKMSNFRKDISKIRLYQKENEDLENELRELGPYKIASFALRNFGPIKECELNDIPKNNQWIFLTGENGVGKSSILKGLAMGIAHRTMPPNEKKENHNYQIDLKFHTHSGKSMQIHRRSNNQSNRVKPYTSGFAAYGPFRLNPIYGSLGESKVKKAKTKTGRFESLFNNDGYLLDLESEFKTWENQQIKTFEKRKYAIIELLQEALLNIHFLEFTIEKGKPITIFHEEDSDGNLLQPVKIDKLSSGYTSIMAMMSDMLIRLFKQQPKVQDPADLEGVVFIDEIDIHLHPKFQIHIIEQLTAAFPNVQFIVTTHSPLPILGAPINSIICVVERDKKDGVTIRRLDKELPIENMMPNNLLTSPIFGLKELFPNSHSKEEKIRTEDRYEDILKNDEIKKYLKDVAKNMDKN